jgi:aspartyl aminopeptidase
MTIPQEAKEYAQDLLTYIHDSPSEFHVVHNAEKLLLEKGFEKLLPSDSWTLKRGGKYFCMYNSSSVVAFIVGSKNLSENGFRVITTHTDSPAIRIKPNPEVAVDNHFLKLNAEVYGSAILNTWLDRPLGMAGRVFLKGINSFSPREALVRFDEPLLYIPNQSIHHNKDVNSGFALNAQKDLLPLLGLVDQEIPNQKRILRLLSRALGVEESEILSFELRAVECEKGCLVGEAGEFISSKKLDNLALFHAGLLALGDSAPIDAATVFCGFDNEEIGNKTRQGAESPMLATILERISLAVGEGREDYLRALERSFMISADMSQSLHPNAPEKSDPVSKTYLNKGINIKFSGAQKFTTDASSMAVFQSLCAEAGVPYQHYLNRSDAPGGSTAGPSVISQIPMMSVDMGIPLLAMHSIREFGGTADMLAAKKAFVRFFA